MRYVAFVGSRGAMPREAVDEMNRDFPAYFEEMERRGVRLVGRELEFPETAVTVRVREGETLLSDGPFAETKEHIAGIDVLECADLDEAVEVEAKSPVARFLPFEIRPVRGEFMVGERAAALEARDDSAGAPYLLMVWNDGSRSASTEPGELSRDCEVWRTPVETSRLILGGVLDTADTATTLRTVAGAVQLTDGSFLATPASVVGLEAIACSGRDQAIELAASHPAARHHAIEVRAFG
jgi:hypothetical protein